jgi:uncharacterized protein (TIGR02284 family)
MQVASEKLQQGQAAIYTVIQNLIDSQEALVEVGEKLADPDLKRFLLNESLVRAEFRGELEAILNFEGVGDLRETGTTAGTVHRAWAGFRFRFNGDDHTLLAAAEQGEEEAEEAYELALEAHLRLPIRQVLTVQAVHIQAVHEYIKAALGRCHEHAA